MQAASYVADRALLPDGWAGNVRVRIGADGRITDVSADVQPEDGDVRLSSRVLLPAPCNLHSHAFQRALAGLTEARGADGRDSFWTWRTLMYRFLDRMTPDDITAIAALAYVEMLEAGYAAVGEFHYVHHQPGGELYADPAETSLRIAAAAQESGIGLTHLPVLYMQGGVDGRPLQGGQLRFRWDLDGIVDLIGRMRAHLAGDAPDAYVGIAPHSLRAVPREILTALPDAVPDGPIHIHIAEQLAEIDEVETAYGARPVDWLLGHLPVDGRWCAVHATHMTPGETEGLARSRAVAGLCPITEANLGDGIFDGVRFRASGGRFGIGTDSNVRIRLGEELRVLEESQRYREHGRAVLASEGRSAGRTLVDGVLAGGAQAIGRASGALQRGMWADMLALDADDLALAGLDGDTLLDAWIFAGDDRLVTDLWSAGRHMVQAGRHIHRGRIAARARDVLLRLRDAL